MSLSVGTGVPTFRAPGGCQPLITVNKSAFFTERCISCFSYQTTVLGCSATNRFVNMEAAREQVECLMEVSLVCHCHATIVAALCKCPLLYCAVSSAGFCQKWCYSILGKIIPEALSCPHFLLSFCFIFLFS